MASAPFPKMERLLVLLGLTFAAVEIRGQGHGHGEYVPPTSEVDHSIDDTHEHYNSHLCLEILLLPCSHHRPVTDERVCGNDGVLYPDHCHFAHARCMFTHLRVDNSGWCFATETHPTHPTTTPAPTPLPHLTHSTHATHTPHPSPVVTTAKPIVSSEPVMTSSRTIMPVATHVTEIHTEILHSTSAAHTPAVTTEEEATTPTSPTTPTFTTTPTPEVSTKDSSHEIFQNVFCANAHLIRCPLVDDIYLCGSDGQTYFNRCFLSKVKCLKPDLRTSTDFTLCH